MFSISKITDTTRVQAILVILAITTVGIIFLISASAANGFISIEVASPNEQQDVTASGNSFVQFGSGSGATPDGRFPIIFDCDCVNEVDDQFALAYALVRDDIFDVRGVTTNNTGRVLTGANNIARHTQEAQFVVDLVYGPNNDVPVVSGADTSSKYNEAAAGGNFGGVAAADFIISEAKHYSPQNKLIIVTVGKVTNAAMALARDPSIADSVAVYSLGGNYPLSPDPESNIFQDPAGVNKLLDGPAEFEMFSNNFTKQGAAKITLNKGQIDANIKGMGPRQSTPVASPYGQSFTTVGDFLSFLADRFFPTAQRPMYDTAPIAGLIDENLGVARTIPAPRYSVTGGAVSQRTWVNRPNNPRSIVYWEDFNLEGIRQSMYASFVANDSIPTYTAN